MSQNEKKRIGRYALLEEIGRGGMAVVYRAEDTSLRREVALKVLHPHLASHDEARNRFRREAHAVARIHHPTIVEVYDYIDELEDEICIVMEFIEGTTLRKFLSQRTDGPMIAEAAALIARRVFQALSVAHENGVVHRDVKPENILIRKDGEIKLSDFGIAHLAGLDQMTVTGQILGSPAYMSPEHIEMAELDARADIFSAGTLLYELAVGSLPFHGKNPHQIIKRIVEGYYDQPLSVAPGIGHGIAHVITRCMQRDPAARFESAAQAVEELDRALAAVGIQDPEKALGLFLEDPAGWEESVKQQVVAMTLSQGQAARKGRRLPEAMDHFNRVLALDPGNEKALDAVTGLSRSRRLRRGAERVAIGLAVGIVIAGVVIGIIFNRGPEAADDDPPEDPATPRLAALDDKVEKAGPTTTDPSTDRDAGLSSSKGTNNKDAGVHAIAAVAKKVPAHALRLTAITQKAKRKVVFNPSPMRVEIEIDGTDRFVFKTTDRARELSEGSHTVRFIPEDPRRAPLKTVVTVTKGEGPMVVPARLKWKPATVNIKSNVKAAVVVPGRAPGKTNRSFEIPLVSGPSEQIKMVVSAEGYRQETRQVTIEAGKAVELTVNLAAAQDSPPS